MKSKKSGCGRKVYKLGIFIASVSLFVFLSSFFTFCTRTEIIDIPPPVVKPLSGNKIAISDVADLPSPVPFDRVRVNITGIDHTVIGTLQTAFSGGKATLTLPESFPAERLCKAVRADYNDYEGYWPAEEASDRSALVAAFEGGDIIAMSDDTPVGRLYLTDRNATAPDPTTPATAGDCRHYIYYLYSDRPVELSGYNLRSPREDRPSFRYEASFAAGWNAYANITYYAGSPGENPPPSLCTTDIPVDLTLRWRFEAW